MKIILKNPKYLNGIVNCKETKKEQHLYYDQSTWSLSCKCLFYLSNVLS